MTALQQARVLVVGAGGLGCPVSLQLARAGVGALTLCDPDRVEPSNLHRQLWHGPRDVGRPKVHCAAEKLARAFPGLKVTPLPLRVDAQRAPSLFADHALVVDATDGVEGKFMLADAAWAARVPLVYGGVVRMAGQAMLLAPGGPCLRCLFEVPPAPDEVPSCAQAGVLGTMAGIIGAMQAELALGYLRGQRAPSGEAELRLFDGAAFGGRTVRVRRRADCAFCAIEPSATVDITREVCPMTYVRTKLALEALADGEALEVLLRGEEPVRNVPRSAQEEGHQVVCLQPRPDGTWRLIIRKNRSASCRWSESPPR